MNNIQEIISITLWDIMRRKINDQICDQNDFKVLNRVRNGISHQLLGRVRDSAVDNVISNLEKELS
jgi:hypothetical protein